MKKLTLVIALAAALPMLAQADVTISGVMAVGVDQLVNPMNHFTSTTGVDDFGSKIDFKGTDSLGNGLQTVWQVETGFNADGSPTLGSGSGMFANRQTFVGLVDQNYGTIRMGRLNDVLLETESTDNLYSSRNDYGYNASGDSVQTPLYENGSQPFGFTMNNGDGRAANSVRYDSPTWNGFNAIVQYIAGENSVAGTNTTQGSSSTDDWGYHIGYTNAATNLFVNIAQMTELNMNQGSNGLTSRIESGYNGDSLTLAATFSHDSMYANTTSAGASIYQKDLAGNVFNYQWWNAQGINNTNSHLVGNSWAVYAAYTLGAFKPQIEYSQRKNASVDGISVNTGARDISVALDYTLSKETFFEGGYGQVTENAGIQALNRDASSKLKESYITMIHDF
jgi:predicted porin